MLMMWLLLLFSFIFCRFFAGYDSRFQNSKYITIKNPKLRKLLLDKDSFFEKTNRPKKDINKITISGLVFYIFGFLTLVVSTLLYFIVPKTPIEPFEIETNEFYLYVDTLNEKFAAGCTLPFFLAGIFALGIYMFKYAKMIKEKWVKILIYVACAVIIIAVLLFAFFIAKEFFTSF